MLPDLAKQPWPPASWVPFAKDIEVADAWYSGDEDRLHALYAGVATRSQQSAWQRFWGRKSDSAGQPDGRGQSLHIPVAADIASTGADLLFGEMPEFTMAEAHGETPDADALVAEERLNELIGADGWASTLVEAAEISGGLGCVYLRPVVDTTIADHPMLTVVHPDVAVPEFRYGHLVAVTFWQQFPGDNGDVWRHLERHEPGVILHGLYCGNAAELGVRHPLTDRAETTPFAKRPDGTVTDGTVDLTVWGITGLLPRYVPNALPNRRHRTQPVGRSDTAGTEHLMDSLDEIWTSWLRDIRLAKARLIVPDEFLDHGQRGTAATFNMDRELFSPLAMDPASMERAGITLVQFDIRVQQHADSAMATFKQIVQTAGYSPGSFGMSDEGPAKTATEVDDRKGRSESTNARKQTYWAHPLEDIGEIMLQLDAGVFKTQVTPMRPTVTYPGAAEQNMRDTASTLNLINLAKSASTETKVRMLNPTWDESQVQAEVERIQAEDAVQVSDPMAGLA